MSHPFDKLRVPLLLLAAPLLLGAAPPRQEPEPNALADWMAAQWNELIIEAMKALATLCWFLEKAAAGITRFLTNEDMWDLIITTTLGSLAGFMPDVLNNLVLGSSGMFYLALMLAGIFMIIPNVSTARLVESSRVMVWGVILSSLFILGTMGYDLIGYAEDIRAYAAGAVIAEASGGDDLDSLVAVPMRATEGDLGDYGFTLPEAFEAEFFPEPTEFEERTVFNLGGSFLTWEWRILVESQASQEYRRDQAETGLAIAGLTLVAGWALLLLGLIFATLTAAALVLIIFFVVALPLGFFEFGAGILAGIVKQYFYLFAVTLLAVGLAGILAGAGWVAFSDPNPGPSEIMAFIPILIIVSIATGYVMSMATSALTGTMGIISSSIRTSMAPLSYAGSMPAAGGIPGGGALSGAASLALTAGAAAATGGASLAATAVAGAGLNALSSSAGGGAASIARAAGSSTQHHVFATAAAGHGPSRVAAVGLRHQRQQRTADERAATKAYSTSSATGSQLNSNQWAGAVDAGGYLTADMRQIEAAEIAHGTGERVTARRHLEAAFGERETAEAALKLYDAGDAPRVRRVVRTTQQVASDLAEEGELPFDGKGKATPLYQERVQAALASQQLVRPRDATDSAHVGRIAGATIRRPVGLWQSPEAPRQLAQSILDEDAPPVTGGDLSAQLELRNMAAQHGWGEAQMEGLFEAVRQGLSSATPQGLPTPLFAAEQLNRQGEWANVPMNLKAAAVSNATLIAESAQLQQGVGVGPVAAASAAAAPPAPNTSSAPTAPTKEANS